MLRFSAFNRSKDWRTKEVDLFYEGLRIYGTDMERIRNDNILLPHKSKKELYEFLKKEDEYNSREIDQCLAFHRANRNNLPQNNDACSMANSFLENELSAECKECVKIKKDLKLNINCGIISLDDVLEETKF